MKEDIECGWYRLLRVGEKFMWNQEQPQTTADDAIRTRLMKIDALIKRGFALTEQLKQYAGDTPMVMRRMRMKLLIKHTLNQYICVFSLLTNHCENVMNTVTYNIRAASRNGQ